MGTSLKRVLTAAGERVAAAPEIFLAMPKI
jgi:hypothetical protein